jgi:hypothetical protein
MTITLTNEQFEEIYDEFMKNLQDVKDGKDKTSRRMPFRDLGITSQPWKK